MKKFRSLLAVIPFLIASLIAVNIYWQKGFPYTHDGSNHLARFANYAAAIREGQFPPRFAPYIFSGFGFPVFNYNYPLENILATPLIWADIHPERVFAILLTLFLTIGSWSIYRLVNSRFDKTSSALAVIVYLSSSYLVNAVVYRGGIGEVAAYGLAPLTFWLLERSVQKKSAFNFFLSVVTLAALWLSHNVLALIFAPLVLIWSGYLITKKRDNLYQLLTTWLLSFGLVAWFWVPAVLELSLIALSGNTLTVESKDHALTLSQLLFSPWRFGFSRIGPLDSLGFGLGIGTLIATIVALAYLTRKLVEKRLNRFELMVFAISLASIYLSLNWSELLWLKLPILPLFQFPWRLLVIFAFFTPVIFAWTFNQATRLVKVILVIFVTIQVIQFLKLKPVDRFHADAGYYLSFPHTTTTKNENRPETWKIDTLPPWEPKPSISTDEAEINVISWLGSNRKYSVMAKTDVLITEPTVYFPGWVIKADGKQIIEPIFNDTTQGLIAYQLTAREQPYQITTSFTGKTGIRLVSELVTVFTIIIFSVLTYLKWKKEQK